MALSVTRYDGGIAISFPSAVSVKFREVVEMLEQDGWTLVRTKGSHRQFRHPVKSGTVTVAGKPGLDVPPGTLNSILKQAGLKEERKP